MPDFVQTAAQGDRRPASHSQGRGSAPLGGRAALSGGPRRRGRPATNGAARTSARPVSRRNTRQPAPRPRRGGNTRANQALELVRERPGITIPEIAKAIKIEPNYLYRVLPRLASDGQVKRDGQGWHPSSSTSTTAPPVGNVRARKQTRATKPQPAASATRANRAQRTAASTPATNGRSTRGATKASVLAALAGGEAMTASQVATTGRARAPHRLDHAIHAGQNRRGPKGRAWLPPELNRIDAPTERGVRKPTNHSPVSLATGRLADRESYRGRVGGRPTIGPARSSGWLQLSDCNNVRTQFWGARATASFVEQRRHRCALTIAIAIATEHSPDAGDRHDPGVAEAFAYQLRLRKHKGRAASY